MELTKILSKIRVIVHTINLESKKIEKELGISIPQLLCIHHLHNAPDYRLSQKELCNKLSLNSSTLSGIIDRLEKKALVARLPKKGDKRVSYISLTSKGHVLSRTAPDILEHKLSKNLSKASEEEKKKINEALDLLTSFLDITDVNMKNPPSLENFF